MEVEAAGVSALSFCPSCPHVVLVLGAVFLDVDLGVVLDLVVVYLLLLVALMPGCAVASAVDRVSPPKCWMCSRTGARRAATFSTVVSMSVHLLVHL